MKRSKFSEEQVAYALRQAEAGTPVGDVCRQLGIAEATFYVWKKRYRHLGVHEVRRVRLQPHAPTSSRPGRLVGGAFHPRREGTVETSGETGREPLQEVHRPRL